VKFIYTYPELCTGCRMCALACSLKKHGECNPKHAAIYVARDEFERWEYPIVCMQCEDPVCEAVCPQNAYTVEDGVVIHDEERCIGCRLCATLCPNAAINTMGTKILKCDQCGGDPECVTRVREVLHHGCHQVHGGDSGAGAEATRYGEPVEERVTVGS